MRDELIDFYEDDEIIKIIYWAMFNLCKGYSNYDVYSLELNLLIFLSYHKEATVFEAIRQLNGVNQIEFAEMLNMTIKKCRNIEKGISYPSADLIKHIYDMFGCRPTLLLAIKDIKWNIIEHVWNNIAPEDEKGFISFINNAIIYYNHII